MNLFSGQHKRDISSAILLRKQFSGSTKSDSVQFIAMNISIRSVGNKQLKGNQRKK